MNRRSTYGIAALAVLGCAGGDSATIVLDRPVLTVPTTFQQIGNIVEMRDGRLALADIKARAFLFVTPATGELQAVGEHADTIHPSDSSFNQHKIPGFVLRFPGDTLGLVDFGAERTTLWNEKGEPLTVINRLEVGGHNQSLEYDAEGNGYKEDVRSVLGGLEPGQGVKFDSLNVLRVPRNGAVADTVARLKLPEWGDGQFGEEHKIVSTIYGGRDLFGVLPDGSIWVARASTNAVDWRDPKGTWTPGPARPFARVPVTEQDKQDFLAQLRVHMSQAGAPAGIEMSYPFADYKPPFSAGKSGPEGQVWLLRSRAEGDSTALWDVVGRDGKQLRTVQLPRGTVLMGFGTGGAVYLVRRIEGKGQVIEKYVVK
jgi:hypothetical protein